jgi:hypothetical protein
MKVNTNYVIAVVIGMVAYSLLAPIIDPLLSGIVGGSGE